MMQTNKSVQVVRSTNISLTIKRVDTLSVIRIQPSVGWVSLKQKELWEYRELLYFLVWHDVKMRYKQTVLAVAWAVIQPFFTMVAFNPFFERLAKIPKFLQSDISKKRLK